MTIGRSLFTLVVVLALTGVLNADTTLVKSFDFSVDGVLPSSDPDIRYVPNPFGITETGSYNVSGGVLHQNTMGLTGWANYESVNSPFTHDKAISMEARLRINAIESAAFPDTYTGGGAYFAAYDGKDEFNVLFNEQGLAFGTSTGIDYVPFDTSQFHTYRLSTPGNSDRMDFYADGQLIHSSTAGAYDRNGYEWGDGRSLPQNGANVDWDYLHVSTTIAPALAPQTHVLSVGVNWPDRQGLPTVVGVKGGTDAERIAQVFEESGKNIDTFPAFLDTQAAPGDNFQKFVSAFNTITSPGRLNPGDTLILYIGSHGTVIDPNFPVVGLNGTTTGVVGAPIITPYAEDLLDAGTVSALLNSPGLRDVNKILIVDACKSANFAKAVFDSIDSKIATIASSEMDQDTTYNGSNLLNIFPDPNIPFGSSFFADELILGLTVVNGQFRADTAPFGNGDGRVSIDELGQYIRSSNHPELTQFINQLEPIMDGGDFKIFTGLQAVVQASGDSADDLIAPEPSSFLLGAIACVGILLKKAFSLPSAGRRVAA